MSGPIRATGRSVVDQDILPVVMHDVFGPVSCVGSGTCLVRDGDHDDGNEKTL